MYIPAAFAETDIQKLHDFIRDNSFGLLVTQVEGRPFASHLPLVLEPESGPYGVLLGHMARPNEQWQHAAGQQALAVFSGPHAYISPTWYEAEQVVPTWNYVAVHATGPIEILDNEVETLAVVERTVGFYEQGMARPWTFDGSTTFAKRMLAQVVAFRLTIERLEGKWKLNQNHPAKRRARVAVELERRQNEDSRAIAALMRESSPPIARPAL